MNRAWSRSVDDAGSMVRNSTSVRSEVRQLMRGHGRLGVPDRLAG